MMQNVQLPPRRSFGRCLLAAAAAVSLSAWGQAPKPAADLDALVKAAKAEGEVLFYSATPENVSKRVAEAFQAKYGMRATYVRLPSVQLFQRYSAEAAAGNIAADALVILGSGVPYAEEGIKNGWIEPLSAVGLPVVKSGEFPAKFFTGPTALVQINPWMIAYNKEKLKGELPKDWRDLLNPRFGNGQILLPDPKVSDAYIPFYMLLQERYGDSYFVQLKAQNPRLLPGGIPAIQALGAGEGSVSFPHITATIQGIKDKGAPVGTVLVDVTTGSESHVMVTARGKAKHPNAARLLVNYVMTQEGNKVFNADPGGFTIYDTSRLPKQYEAPKSWTAERKAQLIKQLGF